MIRLNLGCGSDVRDGWVNVDCAPGLIDPRILKYDLNSYPWPWGTDSVEEVRANALAEHLRDKMDFLEEVFRVCSHGARVQIMTPNILSSWRYWEDPTHRTPWHPCNLEFLMPGHCFGYYTTARFVTLEVRHSPELLEWVVAAYKIEDLPLLARHVDWRASNWDGKGGGACQS